jgi:hypothetical protein
MMSNPASVSLTRGYRHRAAFRRRLQPEHVGVGEHLRVTQQKRYPQTWLWPAPKRNIVLDVSRIAASPFAGAVLSDRYHPLPYARDAPR